MNPSPRTGSLGEPETERTLGELFSDLARETGTLVRQEVQLAKTEMAVKAKEAGKDGAMIGAGAIVGHIAVLALVAGVILALGELIPLWLSALFVGVVLGVAAYMLVQKGRERLKFVNPVPQQTVQTLKEDKQWATRQFTS